MVVDDLRSSPGERVRARKGLEGALGAVSDLEIDLTILAPGSGLAIRGSRQVWRGFAKES